MGSQCCHRRRTPDCFRSHTGLRGTQRSWPGPAGGAPYPGSLPAADPDSSDCRIHTREARSPVDAFLARTRQGTGHHRPGGCVDQRGIAVKWRGRTVRYRVDVGWVRWIKILPHMRSPTRCPLGQHAAVPSGCPLSARGRLGNTRGAKLTKLPSNGRGKRELAHPVTGTAQRVKGAIYAISARCQEDNHRRVRHPSW
jgi:hypothetical protein